MFPVRFSFCCLFCLSGFIGQFSSQVQDSQSARFMCVEDFNSSELMTMYFQVEKNGEYISDVFAYDTATKKIQYPNCSAQLTNGNTTFDFKLTVNTTSGEQIEPSEACGYLHTGDAFTMTMRTFKRLGLEAASDRYYVFECKSYERLDIWKSTAGLTVSDVDTIHLNESRHIKLWIKDADTRKSLAYLLLGQRVFLEVMYTFSSSKEGVDPIGVRVLDVAVAPNDIFAPLYRQMIDENGCPIQYGEPVLSLDKPFSAVSVGPPMFTAESPPFEIGRFSGPSFYYLNFRATLQYCTNVNESCFTNMCEATTRKRRDINYDSNTMVVSIGVQVQHDPQSISASTLSYSGEESCFENFEFVLISSVAAVLLLLDLFVIRFLLVSIKSVEGKVSVGSKG